MKDKACEGGCGKMIAADSPIIEVRVRYPDEEQETGEMWWWFYGCLDCAHAVAYTRGIAYQPWAILEGCPFHPDRVIPEEEIRAEREWTARQIAS